jgi:hypothetical protein
MTCEGVTRASVAVEPLRSSPVLNLSFKQPIIIIEPRELSKLSVQRQKSITKRFSQHSDLLTSEKEEVFQINLI